MYTKSNTIEQFKVLIYVKWRSFSNSKKKQSYAISYREWESVLKVSHQTAVKIIEQCCEDGLIKKERGEYYTNCDGEIRQETNKYQISSNEADETTNVTKE
ncbi:hypothetical protein CV093_10170 [Oceanobacillus sp. 143]|nr:hypothetical protein CV093_10170 [Oceanobacillus sp. 143]